MMSTAPKIEADWTLLYTCNYRCGYCFHAPDVLGSKLRVHASNADWAAAFNAIGAEWHIHLTGGEPTAYPDFADLVARLTARHSVSINTNLTGRAVADLPDRVDPARVSFINAGLHLDERLPRHGTDDFFDRAERLRAAGFNIYLSAVMTPALIARFDGLATRAAEHGLTLLPKVLRGQHEGKWYPKAHSRADLRALLRIFDTAAPAARAVFGRDRAMVTFDLQVDRDIVQSALNSKTGLATLSRKVPALEFRGRPCAAGRDFVSILPDGTVNRCSNRTRLGNLLTGDINFLDAPAPCDTHYCPYFCAKYTDPARTVPLPEVS